MSVDQDERDGISVDLDGYCRAVEAHLCRKNDGHLIRIAGPSFELVRGWAEQGVPLKVALAGIDRTFERYYRKGPRRRPVQVAFCDADVLDAFDDWERAMGLSGLRARGGAGPTDAEPGDWPPDQSGEGDRTPRAPSLPAHLDRVANRLTMLRGSPRNAPEFESALERATVAVDAERDVARQARGAARAALVARLAALDEELLGIVRTTLPADELRALRREAADALAAYRERMAPDAYAGALSAAVARLVRERAGLPVIRYDAGG